MALKTTLAAYGLSVIVGSHGEEEIVPAIGDGTLTPGDLVHIGSDRVVVGADEAAVDLMIGILMESDITGTETANTSGNACEVVIPKSGHRYNIRILDLNADLEVGGALDISGTSGSADGANSINVARCVAAKPIADGDTIAQVVWL